METHPTTTLIIVLAIAAIAFVAISRAQAAQQSR